MPDYHVTWSIDIEGAADPHDAASQARLMQMGPTTALVFEVFSLDGERQWVAQIDLMEPERRAKLQQDRLTALGNFVLDGKPIDIVEFLQDNAELDQVDRAMIGTLQVGESMYLGGGAAPILVLGREPDDEPDDEPRERDPGSDNPHCIHEWAYTGAAYGGDDPGEGRCYCVRCGADGDA